MTALLDRPTFIRRHTRVLPVPLVPEIHLHLADDATDLWQKTEADLGALNLPPPFWAFAWAGGQALARYLIDGPEVVRGARVLDFASGSGLVGIAAAMAGAARVEAADIDLFARDAIALNAERNRVCVSTRSDDLIGRDEGWDVVLAADIFYERDTARAVTTWLEDLATRGARVLVGDPGRTYFDKAAFDELARYEVPVTRSLEDAETKLSGVWRFKAPEAGAVPDARREPETSAERDPREVFERRAGETGNRQVRVGAERLSGAVLVERRAVERGRGNTPER